MAIPLQARVLWRALSRLGGTSLMQLPAEDVRSASDRRRKLIGLPGSTLITGRPHPDVLISDKTAGTIPIRVYRPAGSIDEALPLIVNFHGGGFVSGDPRQSEWWCSSISHDVRAVVVSVDYRLAPSIRSRPRRRTATRRPRGQSSTPLTSAPTDRGSR